MTSHDRAKNLLSIQPGESLAEPLKGALSNRVYEKLRWLQRRVDAEHIPAFLVGGIVRDLLLGYPIGDVDVVLETDALAFARRLAEEETIQVQGHEAFRTATLTFPDGTHLDLVTARSESYPRPGALPQIRPGTLAEDLARRDFGINALALSWNADRFGVLIDLQGGLDDLRQGWIRVFHAGSFVDDPTRLFRAVRYAERYRFRLEPQTERLFHQAVVGGTLDTVSGPRIRREFERIFAEPERVAIVRRLDREGVLSALHPGWRVSEASTLRLARVAQVEHACSRLTIHCVWDRLCWMALLVDVPSEVRLTLGKRLNFDGDTEGELEELDQLLGAMSRWPTAPRPSEVYRICHRLREEVIAFACWGIFEAHPALQRYLEHDRNVRPWITGEDLKAQGLTPGPRYATILWEMLAGQLDGRFLTPQEARRRLGEITRCLISR